MAKKLPKQEIFRLLNEGKPVQVACSYSNTCRWNYLTTSGQVCTENYGYQEDCDTDDNSIRIDLPTMTWTSVRRLQKALLNLSIY